MDKKGGEKQFKVLEAPAEGYESVEGLDQASMEQLRLLEARAAGKTASDYQHIVWAYGVLWALFAIYAIYLWRRALRLRGDVADLQRRLSNLET